MVAVTWTDKGEYEVGTVSLLNNQWTDEIDLMYADGLMVHSTGLTLFSAKQLATDTWLNVESEPGYVHVADANGVGYVIKGQKTFQKFRIKAQAAPANLKIHRFYDRSTSRGQVRDGDV